MIELVKQGKQKEALDFFSTQKGALILNEYYELNNYFGEKEPEIFDAATSNAKENLRFLVSAVLVRALLGIAIALLAAFLISQVLLKRLVRQLMRSPLLPQRWLPQLNSRRALAHSNLAMYIKLPP